jgi:cephalosporin-C deacetylase-like acetyl esterase
MILHRSLVLALALLVTAPVAEVKVSVAPDVASGVYEPGQEASWTVTVTGGDAPAAGKVSTVVRLGGLGEASKGEAELKEGKARVTATRPDPGAILVEVRYRPPGASKDVMGLGGAVFAPDRIKPSAPPPDDFDAFWKGKIAELESVPMNVQLAKVEVGDASVEYYKITMDNIRGSKIQGQIAKPAGRSPLPAILQVQWAGVYPLHHDWVLGHARGGWLAMNISAHDLPIDEKKEFYDDKSAKELKDYPGIGCDDREKSYFLRMFLSCYRAVEYLTKRPDWDKKALAVHGGSQGGYQAIVTAGMHPAVTAMAASVPAGCDHTGKQARRAPGWPQWAGRTWQGKDEAKMLQAARYFDAMNFATRVKCPALVGVGLIDTTCPPEGVIASVNQFKGPKKLVILPRAGHGGDGSTHQPYYAAFGPFLDEAKKGGGK